MRDKVVGDNYAGEWPRERFRLHGVTYEQADKNRSILYQELLPLLNSGRVALVDNPKLVQQLCRLERKSGSSGRDIIDHPRGGHDDLANAVAGVAVYIKKVGMNISDAVLRQSAMYCGGYGGGLRTPMPPVFQGSFSERFGGSQ
jgi:hypothetical protein